MECSTYPDGQCTRYVCENWSEQVGPYWGNANRWLVSAEQDGWMTSIYPRAGDIAVWGAGLGGATDYGHVALVVDEEPLTVSESNWTYPLLPDTRVVSEYSRSGIVGYILPKNVEGQPVVYTTDQMSSQIRELYFQFLLRAPTNAEVDQWVQTWQGQSESAVTQGICNSTEAQAIRAKQRSALGL